MLTSNLTANLVLLAVILVIVASFASFYVKSGKTVEKLKTEERRRKALRNAEKVDEEVDNLGAADVDKRFERWMHNKPR